MGLLSAIGGIAGGVIGGPAGAAIGTTLGGLGESMGNKGASPAVSGYAAMPKQVQDAYLNTYLPGAMTAYGNLSDPNSPYQGVQNGVVQQVLAGPPKYGYQQGARQSYQTAISSVPNPSQFFDRGNQFFDQAGQFLNGAQGNIAAGTAPLTDQRFNNYLNQYMNPYQQQVVNNATNNIQRAADIQRSKLNSSATAAGAFGNDRDAIERGLLNQDTLRQVGDTSGNLLYSGFNNAANNALGQYKTETGNALTGAQIGIGGAGTAGNLGTAQYNEGNNALSALNTLTNTGFAGNVNNLNNFYTNANAKLGAAGVMQQQQTAPSEFLKNALAAFNNGQIGQNPGKPNGFSTLGSAITGIGGTINKLNNPSSLPPGAVDLGNSMPWNTPSSSLATPTQLNFDPSNFMNF